MEREGRGREERGRRGEKMRKIISVMIILVMMGCNSRVAELEKENEFLESIANLGKGFLDVFVTFGDMISGAFGIKADTKKSEIGKYFSDIATTMESVKTKLKDEVSKNGQYAKVKTVVDEFITGTLDKIASGAKEAAKGATGEDKIGGATGTGGQDANPADAISVNSLVKGIKEIVGVVLKKGEGDAEATKTNNEQQKTIGKLFSSKSDGTEAEAAAASASIGAVSGADILRAIAGSGEAANNEVQIANANNAAEIAAAKQEASKELTAAKKDAVIAGGIALRGMAKGGKLAAKSEEKSAHAVNGVTASAVGKVLSSLIVAIRDTVDSGLKKIKEELGKVKEEDKFEEVVNTVNEAGSVKR